jgi:hypothetical protein
MQLKMIHMMGRESVKLSSLFSVFLIKGATSYMVFTIEGRRYRRSFEFLDPGYAYCKLIAKWKR